MKKSLLCWLARAAVLCGLAVTATAQEEAAEEAPSLPFPLHTVEGSGGVILVPTAYLVNPPAPGDTFGLPAVGFHYANLDEKDLTSFTFTETLRLAGKLDIELGYAYTTLQLGDLRSKLKAATAADIGTNHSALHTFSVRANLIKEGAFDKAWMPAVTLGAHYKKNDDVSRADRKLGGALRALGVEDDDGIEFTLAASKTIADPLPRPVIVSVCGRLTEASHIGLLGFSGNYTPLLEASAVCLLTDRLALAAEYRMKPNEVNSLGGLVRDEEDWWDVGFAYIFNEHLTAHAGYVDYGTVLDEHVGGGFLVGAKWEF